MHIYIDSFQSIDNVLDLFLTFIFVYIIYNFIYRIIYNIFFFFTVKQLYSFSLSLSLSTLFLRRLSIAKQEIFAFFVIHFSVDTYKHTRDAWSKNGNNNQKKKEN